MHDDNLDDFEEWLKAKEFRSGNVTAVGFGVEKVRDAVLALANVMRKLEERLQKLEDTK
jgi:hypothetical protein